MLIAMALMVSVTACGNKTGGDSTGAESGQEPASGETAESGTETEGAETSGLESVEPVTLKLAHIYAAEHPFTIGLDELFPRRLTGS